MAATRERERTGNRLLDNLSDPDRRTLAEALRPIDLSLRQSIYQRDEPVDRVYYPVNCVISLVAEMTDGRAVEIATIGNEGMVGLPLFLQTRLTSEHRAFCQIPGQALWMDADSFLACVDELPALRTALQRYTMTLFAQVAQSSACNRLHEIEQRCARWLLLTHDRVQSDTFPLTQEFLAQMLGVQRTSVNGVARSLQDAGAIRYTRGVIEVLDREKLEAASCECYQIIVREAERNTSSEA
jgi:CRP-like cAMP-binding protein